MDRVHALGLEFGPTAFGRNGPRGDGENERQDGEWEGGFHEPSVAWPPAAMFRTSKKSVKGSELDALFLGGDHDLRAGERVGQRLVVVQLDLEVLTDIGQLRRVDAPGAARQFH